MLMRDTQIINIIIRTALGADATHCYTRRADDSFASWKKVLSLPGDARERYETSLKICILRVNGGVQIAEVFDVVEGSPRATDADLFGVINAGP